MPSLSKYALALEDVTCTFASRESRRDRYTAVRDTSLAIAPGEFVSVVGPTGCGKSTLLNVSAGLLEPSSGTVKVFGETLKGINRRAGYMFQADALIPWRSALDNVTAGLAFQGVSKSEADARGEEWLKRVGLGGFGDRYPHQLSGGMRKRVAMAQTLILDPDIILMDEPFSALDIQTRQLMENELLDLWPRSARPCSSSRTISTRRSRCPTASSCWRRGRARIRSANSRSTCRARAMSPRSARILASSSCTHRSGACCARKC